jgi:hypothetical protein
MEKNLLTSQVRFRDIATSFFLLAIGLAIAITLFFILPRDPSPYWIGLGSLVSGFLAFAFIKNLREIGSARSCLERASLEVTLRQNISGKAVDVKIGLLAQKETSLKSISVDLVRVWLNNGDTDTLGSVVIGNDRILPQGVASRFETTLQIPTFDRDETNASLSLGVVIQGNRPKFKIEEYVELDLTV